MVSCMIMLSPKFTTSNVHHSLSIRGVRQRHRDTGDRHLAYPSVKGSTGR